jgi:hypothetical protein
VGLGKYGELKSDDATHACGSSAANNWSRLSRSISPSPPIPIPASIQNCRRETKRCLRPCEGWQLHGSIMEFSYQPIYTNSFESNIT